MEQDSYDLAQSFTFLYVINTGFNVLISDGHDDEKRVCRKEDPGGKDRYGDQ